MYIHTYIHTHTLRKALQRFDSVRVNSSRTKVKERFDTIRSFQVTVYVFVCASVCLLFLHHNLRRWIKRKLWRMSSGKRLSAIGNIRRRMCSLPRPWPTWPVSDSVSPVCAASKSTGTACPGPRGAPRP